MVDILVIDDDPQVRRLVTRILSKVGHSVRGAPDGDVGLAELRETRASVVITDLMMPNKEGIETIGEIVREFPTIPILAISGASSEFLLQAAVDLGATAALPKPFSADALISAVEDLVSMKTTAEAVAAGSLVGEVPPMEARYCAWAQLAPEQPVLRAEQLTSGAPLRRWNNSAATSVLGAFRGPIGCRDDL